LLAQHHLILSEYLGSLQTVIITKLNAKVNNILSTAAAPQST